MEGEGTGPPSASQRTVKEGVGPPSAIIVVRWGKDGGWDGEEEGDDMTEREGWRHPYVGWEESGGRRIGFGGRGGGIYIILSSNLDRPIVRLTVPSGWGEGGPDRSYGSWRFGELGLFAVRQR